MSAPARLVWIGCLLFACGTGLRALSRAQEFERRSPQGEERPTFTVSGRVVDGSGQPARNVTLSIGAERDGGFVAESCDVEPDGVFETRPLEPGLYVLDAAAPLATEQQSAGAGGYATVIVRNAAVTGVTVTLRQSATVAGLVRFESEHSIERPRPRVTVHAFLAVERMRVNHSAAASMADDGTFMLPALHGPRLIRAGYATEGGPSGWWPKAVLLDGKDVTNVPIDFSTKPSARLEVVFSDRPTAVVGIVHDEAGLPVEGARVLLFSKDQAMWAAWSTAVQTGVSDENGRFWFVDAMPAGDYRAIALRETSPPSIAKAVDELPRLEKSALPIVVGESKIARIELIISRAR
jgi:hypothetical protein